MKKRILSLLLALVILVGVMPASAIVAIADDRVVITIDQMVVGEEYTARIPSYAECDIWDVYVYKDATSTSWSDITIQQSIGRDELPSEITIMLVNASDSRVYVTSDNWPSHLDSQRYLDPVNDKIIIYDNPKESKIESSLGSFNVSVSGDVPADAKLNLGAIAEEDLDQGILDRRDVNMKSFVGAFDISITQNGSEWQPESGKPVTVTMNAAALGLYTGQEIYIIHMHENGDGTKEYEVFGPTFVGNGRLSFKTDKFSNFAIYQGNGAVVVTGTTNSNNPQKHTIYVEPGSTIALAGRSSETSDDTFLTTYISHSGADSITKGSASAAEICGDSSSGSTVAILVDSSAEIGDTAIFKVSFKDSIISFLGSTRYADITVVVSTRAHVTDVALNNYPLVIGIRKPADDGTFPSEPIEVDYSTGDYFFLQNGNNDTDQTNDGIVTSATNYYSPASTFLDPTVMGNSFGWMYDVSGNAIGGVIDSTGYYTKACFKTGVIDWVAIAKVIAQYNDGIVSQNSGSSIQTLVSNGSLVSVKYQEEKADGSGFEYRAIVLTTVKNENTLIPDSGFVANYSQIYYEEFELIPYVVKLAAATIDSDGWFNTSSDSVWHVDISLVRGDAYTISYDLNLGANIVASNAVSLPQSRVYVESPSDSDTKLTYSFDSADKTTPTQIQVYHLENKVDVNKDGKVDKNDTFTATFKGWYTSNTAPNDETLYGPTSYISTLNPAIDIYGDTKLYAIWEIEGLSVSVTTFSIDKQVILLPGSPMGSSTPDPGEADFIRFNFSVDIPYDEDDASTSQMGGIYFEVYRWKADYSALEVIVPRDDDGSSIDVITLAEMCAGTSVTPSYFTITKGMGKTTLTFELADGEYVRFLNVPYFEEGSNSFTITENIPSGANRYTATSSSQTIVLSKTTEARATFINQYDAPTAGLQINVSGDEGEYFIFEVYQRNKNTSTSVLFTTVVVPANDTAVVVGLANDNHLEYIVQEKESCQKWSWRWGDTSAQTAPAFDASGTSVVNFTPTSTITKWLFGNTRSFNTSNVTLPTTD